MEPNRLVVISPVRNESAFLERVAGSVAGQTQPPAVWVVVDDGCDDDTPRLLDRLESELPFLIVRRLWDQPDVGDRRVATRAPRAFNAGLALVRVEEFDYVAKLDGDVELPSRYFETVISRMRADPGLGIACGGLVEPRRGGWTPLTVPDHHVHGALKVYSRDCFERIGGILECLGWDTIDETCARMHGFTTRCFSDVVAMHHRPSGAGRGRFRRRVRQGAGPRGV